MKRVLLAAMVAMVLAVLLGTGCRSNVSYFGRGQCICEKRSGCVCPGTARRSDCSCPKRPSCRCGTKMDTKIPGEKK